MKKINLFIALMAISFFGFLASEDPFLADIAKKAQVIKDFHNTQYLLIGEIRLLTRSGGIDPEKSEELFRGIQALYGKGLESASKCLSRVENAQPHALGSGCRSYVPEGEPQYKRSYLDLAKYERNVFLDLFFNASRALKS